MSDSRAFDHHPSVKIYTNLEDSGQVRRFYDSLTDGSNFHFISYASGDGKAEKQESEDFVASKLREILKRRVPKNDECLLLQSYVFRSGGKNQETDFILISKKMGIIIMESKATVTDNERSCPRAAMLNAWKQVEAAVKGIKAFLHEDVNLVGENYGVNQTMIDKICNGITAQSFATLPGAAQMNLQPCGKLQCKTCQRGVATVEEQHRYVNGNKRHFALLMEMSLCMSLNGRNQLTRCDTENLFVFLLRRFVGLKHLCRLCVLNPAGISKHQSNMDREMSRIEQQNLFLTREQMELLKFNDTRYISDLGPAGSGKTVLLIAKVQELMENFLSKEAPLIHFRILIIFSSPSVGLRILQVLQDKLVELLRTVSEKPWTSRFINVESFVVMKTQSQFLEDYLGWEMDKVASEAEMLDSYSYTGIRSAKSPVFCSDQYRYISVASKVLYKFTHIFADDVQWIIECPHYNHWLEDLKMLVNPSRSGCFWILFDPNQVPFLNRYSTTRSLLDKLTKEPECVPLRQIFRSTGTLTRFSLAFARTVSDCYMSHNYKGPKVQVMVRFREEDIIEYIWSHVLNPLCIAEVQHYRAEYWKAEGPHYRAEYWKNPLYMAAMQHYHAEYWKMNASTVADVISEIIEQLQQINVPTTNSTIKLNDISVIVDGLYDCSALKTELERGNGRRRPIDVGVDFPNRLLKQPAVVRTGVVHDFYGIDSPVVIYFNCLLEGNSLETYYHYMSITRATTYLFIVTTDQGEMLIRQRCKEFGVADCIADENSFAQVEKKTKY